MTRPLVDYDGPERLPWPGTLSRRMARILWDGLEPFVNMERPEPFVSMGQPKADGKPLPLGSEPISG